MSIFDSYVDKQGNEKFRSLDASRVKQALQTMKVGIAKFEEAYTSIPRASRGPRPPTDEQIAAVEEFTRTGSMDKLKDALGVKTDSSAQATISKVFAYRAQNGEG